METEMNGKTYKLKVSDVPLTWARVSCVMLLYDLGNIKVDCLIATL